MIKEWVCLGFLFLIGFSLASAESPEAFANDPFAEQIINASQKAADFTQSENKSAYLQQEWTKMLEENQAGRFIIDAGQLLEGANPLIEKMIGLPYSLSWAFFFALLIWFTFAGFAWRPLHAALNNNGFALVLAFVFASLAGFFGVIRTIVEVITLLINNWWIALIAFLAILILMVFFERLGKVIAQKIRKAKEAGEKAEESQNRQILGAEAKSIEEGGSAIRYRTLRKD